MAKFFPLMNIGQMHFNRRQTDCRDGVPDRDAGVGIGGRVDDDPVVSRPSLLDPGDQFTFSLFDWRRSTFMATPWPAS